MIRGTPELQTVFAQLKVSPLTKTGHETQEGGTTNGAAAKIHVIDALLQLVLDPPTDTSFDLRLAATECVKAYFYHHREIRLHFLGRAIEGYELGEDETPNVLSTLLQDSSNNQKQGDLHRVWFAAIIVLHLIWEDSDAKKLLMKVSEGDAESGEEVVSCIQLLAGNLVTGIQRDRDERALIGLFMLLSAWLFEEVEAVNDLLGEGSNLQTLMQTASASSQKSAVIKGLSAVLLGNIYEFSTKDSPIPRRKLQQLLSSGIGAEQYKQALSHLRQHPLIRDFEVSTQGQLPTGFDMPAYAYFDETFIEFLKDNFSRFRRAIDRDPGMEVQVASGEQGIDRDLVDSLRSQLETKKQALQKAEAASLELEHQLDQEQANHRRDQETSMAEIQRVKQADESRQQGHQKQIEELQAGHRFTIQDRDGKSTRQIQELSEQLAAVKKESTEQAERTKEYYERSITQLRNSKKDLEAKIKDATETKDSFAQTVSDLQRSVSRLRTDLTEARSAVERLQGAVTAKDKAIAELEAITTQLKEKAEDEQTKVTMLETETSELVASVKALGAKLSKSGDALKSKEEARSSAQTELDDLLLVMQDLEDKRTSDKVSEILCSAQLETLTLTNYLATAQGIG